MAREPGDVDAATLRLLVARGVGPATIRRLRARFGSDERVVAATAAALRAVGGVSASSAGAIRRAIDDADPEAERHAMAGSGARLILRGDDDYPPLLALLPEAPEALWVRGAVRSRDRLALSIVGARRATAYGVAQAGRFAALLAQAGLTIVSGGAVGVDGAAHRGALRVRGRTLVVLGCGLGTCYPPQHRRLFEEVVAEGGALLTEHPMGAAPRAVHFPRRNRIISGLSLGVLVVEARARSGALITARIALEEHGREVMALPGRVDAPLSAGCLRLLQDGAAGLVIEPADVLRQLDTAGAAIRLTLAAVGAAPGGASGVAPVATPGTVPGEEVAAPSDALLGGALTAGQRGIVSILSEIAGAMPMELLADRVDRPLHELMADVTFLELRGRVTRDAAGVRLRRGSRRDRGGGCAACG